MTTKSPLSAVGRAMRCPKKFWLAIHSGRASMSHVGDDDHVDRALGLLERPRSLGVRASPRRRPRLLLRLAPRGRRSSPGPLIRAASISFSSPDWNEALKQLLGIGAELDRATCGTRIEFVVVCDQRRDRRRRAVLLLQDAGRREVARCRAGSSMKSSLSSASLSRAHAQPDDVVDGRALEADAQRAVPVAGEVLRRAARDPTRRAAGRDPSCGPPSSPPAGSFGSCGTSCASQ